MFLTGNYWYNLWFMFWQFVFIVYPLEFFKSYDVVMNWLYQFTDIVLSCRNFRLFYRNRFHLTSKGFAIVITWNFPYWYNYIFILKCFCKRIKSGLTYHNPSHLMVSLITLGMDGTGQGALYWIYLGILNIVGVVIDNYHNFLSFTFLPYDVLQHKSSLSPYVIP